MVQRSHCGDWIGLKWVIKQIVEVAFAVMASPKSIMDVSGNTDGLGKQIGYQVRPCEPSGV